jgi:hypothetical protein
VTHIFVGEEETVIVVLKILGATIKNLVIVGAQALEIFAPLP